MKNNLLLILLLATAIPFGLDADWRDRWESIKGYFPKFNKPTFQMPSWFSNIKRSQVTAKQTLIGFTVGGLAIAGGLWWRHKSKETQLNKIKTGVRNIELDVEAEQRNINENEAVLDQLVDEKKLLDGELIIQKKEANIRENKQKVMLQQQNLRNENGRMQMKLESINNQQKLLQEQQEELQKEIIKVKKQREERAFQKKLSLVDHNKKEKKLLEKFQKLINDYEQASKEERAAKKEAVEIQYNALILLESSLNNDSRTKLKALQRRYKAETKNN